MNLTVRSRWGPPRELRVTRLGVFYVALTVGMGLAGINTGNNLVMLTCGVMLGLIIASGVLSERCLRELDVTRELPAHFTVGAEGLVVLALENPKPFSSFGVLVSELDGSGQAHFPLVGPGATIKRAYRFLPRNRGVVHLRRLRVSTAFPFGIFEKSLVIERPRGAHRPSAPRGSAPQPGLPARPRRSARECRGVGPRSARAARPPRRRGRATHRLGPERPRRRAAGAHPR